jgi:cell division protein FtsQ
VNRKRTIKRIIILAAWLLVISAIATVLIAANRRQKQHVCSDVIVGIKGESDKYYVEKSDVMKMMEKQVNGSLLQWPVTKIDILKLEHVLEANAWIRNAELYFDNKDALHVSVEEREPVARIFTVDGSSFYIDSSGQRMPLLEKVSARVPVVTGFPSSRKLNSKDSVILSQVKMLTQYINTNDFWNKQIGSIDITGQGSFELIPVIGDHVIRIGDAGNLDEKLNRLYIFYKQVMSKVGFNKYKVVDVEFDGQVVAENKGLSSAVDSLQLQKNIEELFRKNDLQHLDDADQSEATNVAVMNAAVKKDSTVSTQTAQKPPVIPQTEPAAGVAKKSNPLKKPIISKPKERPKQVKKNQKPKAVMPGKKH